MNNTTEDLIGKVLEISHFEGDRQAFIDEFISNIQFEALLNVINGNTAKKEEWLRSLNRMEKPEQIQQFISENISNEDYTREIEAVSEKTTADYLRTIVGSLTENQKQQIEDLQNLAL
jgi:hypothetical protein